VSSSDWMEQSESLTCGSRSTVSVDRSMFNVDRGAIGLGWAWAGPDLGQTGLGRPRHVSSCGFTMSRVWVSNGQRVRVLSSW
jgi:hypothetical protein